MNRKYRQHPANMNKILTQNAYAAGDPISTVNKLSEFIFSLIRAIGLILLGLGIMQVGLSLKSHDPSQRANVLSDRCRWDHHIH